MQKIVDKELLREIQLITGLTDDKLICVSGTVYATMFLGKIPDRGDLSAFLGYSKRTISRILHDLASETIEVTSEPSPLVEWLGGYMKFTTHPRIDQVIYPLATNFISDGSYIGLEEEPFERAIARLYLQTLLTPQTIQEYETFAGYNILLEYLWSVSCGTDEGIEDYLRSRFESSYGALSKVESFLDLISKQSPHLAQIVDYGWCSTICEYMVEELKKLRVRFTERGSAKIAKERLLRMLKDIRENRC